jgi:hypothetical protein
VSLLLRVVNSALEPLHEFRHPALERGLLLHGGQIAYNLTSQGRTHAAERSLRPWGVSQRQNKKRREDRFAGLFISLQGNFHDCSGIDPQSLADVAMDSHPVARLSPRDQGRPQSDSLDRAANRHMHLTPGNFSANLGRNVHIPDQAHFVDTPGENME